MAEGVNAGVDAGVDAGVYAGESAGWLRCNGDLTLGAWWDLLRTGFGSWRSILGCTSDNIMIGQLRCLA
jgi:hypothetical protein